MHSMIVTETPTEWKLKIEEIPVLAFKKGKWLLSSLEAVEVKGAKGAKGRIREVRDQNPGKIVVGSRYAFSRTGC